VNVKGRGDELMAFVLKVTGQEGEQYAEVEGLTQGDAEMVVGMAKALVRTAGGSWPVPVCDCPSCEARRRRRGGQ
jgi:hypothetical protein